MLLLVYNADSGSLNAMLDSAHKLLSPSTYQCKLCELTYGLVRENMAWKAFREQSDEELVFLHRDEFEQQYSQRFEYPFVARFLQGELKLLLSSDEFNAIASTEELIARLNQVIRQ